MVNTMAPALQNRSIGKIHRAVVKVGSGIIAAEGVLRLDAVERLAGDVMALRENGVQVLMVVSGAVAGGYRDLGCPKPPTLVVERQAAASIGQYKLMSHFAAAFGKYGVNVAQLLMTEDDIENRRRFISARHTMNMLLERGVVPIINENDPLADDEAKVGDNDHLAALITNISTSELLIILSSVAGVYRNKEQGEVIHDVAVNDHLVEHISTNRTATGVGGMTAKVSAAKLASRWGVPTIIADGATAGLLPRIVSGEPIGTMFHPGRDRLSSRKRWIAIRHKSRGTIHVDDGAHKAIVERGASLLPAGITNVDGDFAIGARVNIVNGQGQVFAVGLVSYAAGEIKRMQGHTKADYEKVLGYKYVDEIIDRDDLVLMTRDEIKEIDE
ncbi:MAG TPA: glutamate 5-kinase [Phycisphaerae bacterium]|nr:glutamate 5-kinase [Phycisphaerae bacterium]HRW52926.1 glutamate 5-kinase [Phycisphaerae bacterium]